MNKNSAPKKIKKVHLEELNKETGQTAPSKSRMSTPAVAPDFQVVDLKALPDGLCEQVRAHLEN